MVKLLVDNEEIEAEEGTTLLQACLNNNIYIPNLCYLESMDKPLNICQMHLISPIR